MKTFNDYQRLSGTHAFYPNMGTNFVYPTLGLTGEAGEVSEKVKKQIRDKGGKVTHEFRMAMKKELGDVLWYLGRLAAELDFTLEEIAEANIEKLDSRAQRGKLSGSGDDR